MSTAPELEIVNDVARISVDGNLIATIAETPLGWVINDGPIQTMPIAFRSRDEALRVFFRSYEQRSL